MGIIPVYKVSGCFMNIFKSKNLIKYAVSMGILAVLALQMDFSSLRQQAGGLNVGFFFLSLILIVCQILFLNLRWHSYLNVGRQDISFQTSTLINLAGYFANILFITSVGGILAKSALAVRFGLSVFQAVFATFLDRFMTLFALVFFSAIGLPLLYGIVDDKINILLGLSISLIVIVVAGALILLRSGMLKEYILSNRKRSRIVGMLRSYTENYKLMLETAGYSLIAQGCFILAVYALSLGIDDGGHNVHALEFIALVPVLALIASLPISWGGWGIREGAFIYGLGLIGYSMEGAFFLSVQVGLVTLIAPFFVGLPYLLRADLKSFWLSVRVS